MTPAPQSRFLLPILATGSALGAFAVLQLAAFLGAGGVFEYPLDDPYIHMAMAEQIARGGYGVNAGESAAAASSPLFPLLLTPLAGTGMQRYLPLFWNVVGLGATAWLWGRILWQAGYGKDVIAIALAVLGPIALHLVGLAHIGMEHTLHAAASLAIISGLLTFLETGRIGWLLVLGIAVAPLIRFEGAALALSAAFAVTWCGPRPVGVGLMALAIVPLAAFCLFLVSLGLDPLPSSISAKLALPQGEATVWTGFVIDRLAEFRDGRSAQILGVFLIIASFLALFRDVRQSPRRPLIPVLAATGLAHAIFGRYGWMDRYEIYIYVTMAAGLLAVAPLARRRLIAGMIAVPLLMAAYQYLPSTVLFYPEATRAVYLQQAQMARFAKDHLKEPVAVNDLGYVAWNNPDYVLDVWGLANRQALDLRLKEGKPPAWVDRLTDAQGVGFAMIYDDWFEGDLGDDWQKLGRLVTHSRVLYLADDKVSFYITGPADPAPYVAALRDWASDLPVGATFEFAEGFGQ